MEKRFWSKVTIGDGCWEWTAANDGRGYGAFSVGCRVVKAHRVAWELMRSPIPEGLYVCHRCDNPACVKPSHLFLGTAADNSRDMRLKGRSARGERNGMRTHPERVPRGARSARARLTEAQVRQIKCLLRGCIGRGEQRAIARRFGVSDVAISEIKHGTKWKHVVLEEAS